MLLQRLVVLNGNFPRLELVITRGLSQVYIRDLYIQALQALQQVNASDPLSYFQICGRDVNVRSKDTRLTVRC